ncbi:ferredoxin [Actinomadura sp. NPDC000600]|uniref:ferredoxin n=1 Tax=Actinomadura sp. NPDC000600 TaxID=3154262 RepID=UPI003393ECE3
MQRVGADPGVCMGSGLCEHIAPTHFRLENGAVRLIEETVAPDRLADVAEAVDACPTRALRLLAGP